MTDSDSITDRLFDGKYVLLGRAGEGGHGEVMRALDRDLDRIVAIKMLTKGHAQKPHAINRLQREALLLSKLDHPNIARVYSFAVTSEGTPYLVMEYLQANTLSQRIASSGTFSIEDWSVVARQLCDAISYAHAQNVIHRDIKPQNILLVQAEGPGGAAAGGFFVKLVDFGMAKPADSEPTSLITTGSNPNIGTPIYASPEQYGAGHIDHRTDIYSLSCVFYEMLAGKPPYVGGTVFETMMYKLETTAPLIPALVYYPALEAALLKGLSPKSEDRFQTINEYREAIEAALQAPASSRQPPNSKTKRRLPRVSKLSTVTFAVILSALVAIGCLAYLQTRPGSDTTGDGEVHYATWKDALKEAQAVSDLYVVSRLPEDGSRAGKTFEQAILVADRTAREVDPQLRFASPSDQQLHLDRIDARLHAARFYLRSSNFVENRVVMAKRFLREAGNIIDELQSNQFPLTADLMRRNWILLDALCFGYLEHEEAEKAQPYAENSLKLRTEGGGTESDLFWGRQRLAETMLGQSNFDGALPLVTANLEDLRKGGIVTKDVEAVWAQNLILWNQSKYHQIDATKVLNSCEQWLPSGGVDKEAIHLIMTGALVGRKANAELCKQWGFQLPIGNQVRIFISAPRDQI